MSLVLSSDDLPPDDRVALVCDQEPTVFLVVQVSGTTTVAQGEHRVVLRAGDLAVYDGSRPCTVLHAADGDRGRPPLAGSLVLRVQEHVRAHLADRDLSARTIAAAHHVSVRHLYASFARAGIALRPTIREQRLERCRRDLRDPRSAHLTAAAIGARWGFADPSHFSRTFRAAAAAPVPNLLDA